MKKRLFVLIGLSLAAPWLFMSSAFSADYVWKGNLTNPNWSRAQNWTPNTGFPQAAGDKAVFDSSAGSLANVTAAVSPTTVTLNAGFIWAVNATSARGAIVCEDFSLTSGTVTATGADKIRATRKLDVLGGNITHATCEGVATLASGVVGTLRMAGNQTVLQGDDFVPFVFKTLEAGPGTTLQHHVFAPLEFVLDAQTTYTLGPLSSLTVEKHDIQGALQLAPGSLLTFAKGADIAGVIIHSSPPAYIICNGDWKCPGSYWPSFTPANILTINQTLASGIVDHGGNDADMVIIRGKKSAGMNTQWKSDNTIRGLRVTSDTQLSLADGVTLHVEGEILNSGTIQLGAGAVLAHSARMDFQTASGDLSASYFYAGSPLFVRLLDGDQNLEGTEAEKTGGVLLQNSRNGDEIALTLTEISAGAGIFISGPVSTERREEALDDDILQVIGGDTVIVTYADPDDPGDTGAGDSILALDPLDPTPTGTLPPTFPPTPTQWPTFPPTPTDWPTFPPTPTDWPTLPPTWTPEPTTTSTLTATPPTSATLTLTPTPEPTTSGTITSTPTYWPTFPPTPTDWPTIPPTRTGLPTIPPTSTKVETPLPTETGTSTPLPTDTLIPTITEPEPTWTQAPTPTDDITPSPSATIIPTGITTPTLTATWAPTLSPTPETTSTLTPSPVITSTPGETLTPTEIPTTTSIPSATSSFTPPPSQTPQTTPSPYPKVDSDGDGFVDDYEIATGHDPNNVSDYPSLGDIDGDGRSGSVDAFLLYRWIKGKITLPDPPCPKGDVNLDGNCDTTDALILYRWSIGLPGYETLPMN